MTDAPAADLPLPEPYQEEGIAFLAARRHAILGDEMRLGKTPQSILAADQVRAQTIIVVTVAVGTFNWEAQFRRWSAWDREITIVATGKQATPQAGVIILSFEMAKAHATRLPAADLLIVDECHFLKSVDAARTVAILGKSGIIHRARRAWFLSGTPSPNGDPREMWPILFTCGVTRLGFNAFQARYCVGSEGPYGYQLRGLQNVDELQTLLRPFMLRRTWREVMSQLPELTFENITVPASPVDIQLWFPDHWIKDGGASLSGDLDLQRRTLRDMYEVSQRAGSGSQYDTMGRRKYGRVGDAFSTGMEALAPALATLRRYTSLQKAPAVAEMVAAELDRGVYDKLVIFAVHRDPIEFLRRSLAKYKPVTLYGGTSLDARKANLEKFHTNPRCRVFIGQVHASGTNVDLSCASDILFIEQSWTPGDNAQATMRCHNIKQQNKVHVRIVGLANDIDDKVQMTLRRKMGAMTKMFENN